MICEKVVAEQLLEHFTGNNLWHPNHHGFRPNHSTATALIQMYDMWLNGAENGELTAALLLDLSAAFDLVDHQILLGKLRLYNFSEETLGVKHKKAINQPGETFKRCGQDSLQFLFIFIFYTITYILLCVQ